MAGSRKKRTGARRKKTRAATKVPAKLWLAAGVALSALVFGLNSLLPHINEKPDDVAANGKVATAKQRKPKPKEPVFDFYTLLPESEEIKSGTRSSSRPAPKPAPKSEVKSKPSAPQVAKKEAKPKSKPKSKPKTTVEKKGPPVVDAVAKSSETFLLQAGSFRSGQDADRLRAQLILSGYEAKISKVTVRNGELWHRVQLGPYHTLGEVDKAKSRLASQGLEAMLLRQN